VLVSVIDRVIEMAAAQGEATADGEPDDEDESEGS